MLRASVNQQLSVIIVIKIAELHPKVNFMTAIVRYYECLFCFFHYQIGYRRYHDSDFTTHKFCNQAHEQRYFSPIAVLLSGC